MGKIILVFVLFESAVLPQQSDSLIGVWQDFDVVAAGWSNTFLFFPDGTFKFFYSQMDHRKRETGFSGWWKVDGDGLLLDVRARDILEGGRLVADETGGPRDSVLIDAVSITEIYGPPDRVEMSISKFYYGGTNALGTYIYIDAIKFYLMGKNPAELLKEFEGK